MKKVLIHSWLPIFPGFYGTIFEPDESPCIDDDKTFDDYVFDYKQYRKDVAIQSTGAIEQALKQEGFNVTITFDEIYSPREYNFGNDSINVSYVVNQNTLKKVKAYLRDNIKEFSAYCLDKYTSRSGFMSFHSNQANVWINEYLPVIEDNDYYLGAIFDFILRNEEYTDEQLLSDIIGNVCLDAQLKTKISHYINITWFNSKSKRLEQKGFYGANAFANAQKWGRKKLENFNSDMIQTINLPQ